MSKEKKRAKKKKESRRALLLGIAAAVLVACLVAGLVLYLCLREERIDRAERILRENDYLVTVKREGDDSPLTLEPRLRARLRGIDKNSTNVIHILEFKEKDEARKYYEQMKGDYTLMQTMKLYGRYVYFGSIGSFELLE